MFPSWGFKVGSAWPWGWRAEIMKALVEALSAIGEVRSNTV